jgi:hypothetical protein
MRNILYVCIIYFINVSITDAQGKDSFTFSFEDLKPGDTLKIKSEVMYCGEWGGNWESILIYYSYGFYAKLVRDEPDCKYEKKYRDPDKPFARNVELTADKKEAVLNYINLFLNYKDNPSRFCNASSHHSLRFRDKFLYIYDDDCSWEEFIPLRDKLFKTADY